MAGRYPIFELIRSDSVITPKSPFDNDFNKHLVVCFFKDVIDELHKSGRIEEVKSYKSEFGDYPLYNARFNGENVSLIYSPSGAAMAAGVLEEAIAGGVKYIMAIGSCGVLDDIYEARVFIPYSAVRDEGTSYHYLKAEDEIAVDRRILKVIEEAFKESSLNHTIVKTWSTDGLFRISFDKVKDIMMNGCYIIDMECSALLAVSKYYNIKFGQIFYSDYNSRFLMKNFKEWNKRRTDKIELVWLAIESCLMM
ncbi:nucleoside phosphorylase [Mycoplasmatota bacterium]|nr:nucleoside phosphorylase [Mycoplasmatota bacterium]